MYAIQIVNYLMYCVCLYCIITYTCKWLSVEYTVVYSQQNTLYGDTIMYIVHVNTAKAKQGNEPDRPLFLFYV